MKSFLLKIIHMVALFISLINHSDAMELDLNAGISEALQESINSQLESHATPNPKPLILEEENYDDPTDLQPEDNIYRVPEVKNTCGFICGRCQFLHYRGLHPNHDCCSPSSVCFPSVYGVDSRWTYFGVCVRGNLLSMLLSGGPAVLCKCLNPKCPSSAFLPLNITSFIAVQTLMGPMSYLCADCMGNTDFTDSYERGELCLPEDSCSCTSCLGINYYEYKFKYFCCCK